MQPKIYTVDQHAIPFHKIDPQAYYVLEKLKACGHKAYLVGGGVRDLLLKVRPKDFDISTSAKPEEIRRIFRNCILIGKRFRLAHVRFGKKIIEVATFRSGDIENTELIKEDNIWGNEEQDVLRRDFTINGLFYDPSNQTIIDYVDGYIDIDKKLLRTIGNPQIRFLQDPVRMLRLLKFKARFGFQIEEETLQSLIDHKEEIIKSSHARILEELMRMLESGSSKDFFMLLQQYGFLEYLLPSLSSFLDQKTESPLYQLLDHADNIIKKNIETYERSILFSLLLYPLLNETLNNSKDQVPHLGKVYEETKKIIHHFVPTSFHLSRKIKAEMISILINQYRFTPLIPYAQKRKIRLPHDPCFILAMKFFKIRCAIDPALNEIYTEWNTALHNYYKKQSHHQPSSPETISPDRNPSPPLPS
jgi:poly(A) polymerase